MHRREFLIRGTTGLAAAALGARGGALFGQHTADKPVRIGVIGVGNRGMAHVNNLLPMPDVTITAVCDLAQDNLARAVEKIQQAKGRAPATYGKSEEDYKRLLQRDDVDAVLIAAPTKWHCGMAVDAMKAGKHVGSEVPAGFTTDELWELVKTKDKTGKRYMLLENYLYTQQSMMIYEMVRQGAFGEPYYAEAAYLHDCRFMLFKKDGSLDWWGEWASKFYGSDYPTHAMGPVSKWLGINEGDRLSHCCCMMSKPRVLKEYTIKRFGPDSPQAELPWALGEFIATTIMTEQGRLIRMDYDVNSPRPALFPYVLQGTKGVFDSRLGVYLQEEQKEEKWEPMSKYADRFEHPYWKKEGSAAGKTGHGGGDYFVLRDFIEMVHQDREPWIDIYDAASWSVLFDCSRASIDKKGGTVEIPDFTGGRWKNSDWRKSNMRPA